MTTNLKNNRDEAPQGDWAFAGDVSFAAGLDLGANVVLAQDQNLDLTGTVEFGNHVTFDEAKNVVLGTTTGTKIGTATTQKLGFWNATPVVQPFGAAQVAVVGTTAALSSYGYTQAQADAMVALVNEMRRVLVLEGLMKGSA